MVKSFWEESEQGPRKRVYQITQKGRKELEGWIGFLKTRKNQIEKILSKYKLSKVDKDD